jgi:hypothetical protein
MSAIQPGTLADVMTFGRCLVLAVEGSSLLVQGADRHQFWVHRRLVQPVATGQKVTNEKCTLTGTFSR